MITIAAGIRSISNEGHRRGLGRLISKVSVTGGGLGADRGEGGLDQAADMGVALRIADAEFGRRSIGLRGELTPPELGVEIPADKLEQRIGRIFVSQRARNLK